jgi:hypothetical protein
MKTKEYFIRTPEGRIYTTDTPQHWKDSVILKHKEGREALNQLLDIALKQGGLNSFNGVVQIMQSVQPADEEKKENA